jgi:phospholipase C
VIRVLSLLALGLIVAGAARPAAKHGPCGTATKPPGTYAHVIWIVLENHGLNQIVGSSSAPYLTSLARSCGLATNYSAVTHPSLPNYVALTSGDTQGVGDDAPPTDHPLDAVSLFEQAGSAKSYEESMPWNCALTSSGAYAVKHNPEAYYTRIRSDCVKRDVPMGTTSHGAFHTALKNDTLPRFSFVTPNLCNDMHDCSVATGDAWLKRWIPRITASKSYQAGRTALFVTWDENDGSSGNRVAAIVASPFTRSGTKSSTAFNHYSLLRTTEQLLGISTHLGHAASAASMRAAFGL